MSGKYKEFMRTVKFVLFSISAGVIQILSFTVMEEVLKLTHWLAYLISLVLSVLWNFTLNRKFTFHSANNVPVAMCRLQCLRLRHFMPCSPRFQLGGRPC